MFQAGNVCERGGQSQSNWQPFVLKSRGAKRLTSLQSFSRQHHQEDSHHLSQTCSFLASTIFSHSPWGAFAKLEEVDFLHEILRFVY